MLPPVLDGIVAARGTSGLQSNLQSQAKPGVDVSICVGGGVGICDGVGVGMGEGDCVGMGVGELTD